ncbi:MAG TPA: MDR family oxidoreductase, partial [Candidatus Competibacter sp.]|nr:MDR family oxidoreductase [Candidatus Competibacter sp.]
MTDPTTFRALVLDQRDGQTVADLTQLTDADLPPEQVLVAVEYSSLNYKDGLAVTGKGKIVRRFPLVPGIDLAGTVLESASSAYRSGDRVVLTGWGVGESFWGGYAQRARVKAEWLTPLPDSLGTRQAMAIGTAGFTAMLCVLALEQAGVKPDGAKPVLVTGASGGVGSVAVALLAQLGYRIAAVTGRLENEAYLRELGATEFIDRETMNQPCRPLEGQRWSGVVDTVGGRVLARALAETDYGGAVAACGLAGGGCLPPPGMPLFPRRREVVGGGGLGEPAAQRHGGGPLRGGSEHPLARRRGGRRFGFDATEPVRQ